MLEYICLRLDFCLAHKPHCPVDRHRNHTRCEIYFSLNPSAPIKCVFQIKLSSTKETERRRIEKQSWRLTCLAVAEDGHGLSTHCVHSEGMIPRDLQWCILLPQSAQGSQLLIQAEMYLRNTAESGPCWLVISATNSLIHQVRSNIKWWNCIDLCEEVRSMQQLTAKGYTKEEIGKKTVQWKYTVCSMNGENNH